MGRLLFGKHNIFLTAISLGFGLYQLRLPRTINPSGIDSDCGTIDDRNLRNNSRVGLGYTTHPVKYSRPLFSTAFIATKAKQT